MRPSRLAPCLLLGLFLAGCGERHQHARRRPFPVLEVPRERAAAVRDDALARAQVWAEPAVPIERADLLHDPAGPGALPAELECEYYDHQGQGTTPKVHCQLPTGDVVTVKYGLDNPEVFAEVAASRLLAVLGFGADRMFAVHRVRCLGCPPPGWWPARLFAREGPAVYEDASVERRFPGREIRAPGIQGWGWWDLDHVDPARGGAPRAHTDALRLMAVLLAHWDNKAENQRLVCLPGGESADGCHEPFALVQDVGASFGPFKMDLDGWRGVPVWTQRSTCRISLRGLPFQGGTFPDAAIGEAGRRFLGDRLQRLSDAQLRDLFLGARFQKYAGPGSGDATIEGWVAALRAKIRDVVEGPPCPS